MKEPNREIFQLLKRKNGDAFEADVIANWYIARNYVLRHFNDWTGVGIGPESRNTFDIVVDGFSPLMYCVVRQIALMAHFANFDENDENTCSKITINYPESYTLDQLKREIDILSKEEYLCNLIEYSDYTLVSGTGDKVEHKGLPFTDIKFILRAKGNDCHDDGKLTVREDDVLAYEKAQCGNMCFDEKDLKAGMLVNLAYSIGVEINNLPPTDNNTANRYNIALDCINSKRRKDMVRGWNKPFTSTAINQVDLKNALSCIYCADTFESRVRGLLRTTEPLSEKLLIANTNTIKTAIARNLKKLSLTEHARWVAEKLISGFRPMSEEESYIDETNVGRRNPYRKHLKNRSVDPSHIDITSFADLKRINPEDQKYDCFIILAMPIVLKMKFGRRNVFVRLLNRAARLIIRR